MKVGALGTHKALGLAKAKGARFLLASTSEVYGDPLVNPQTEDYWGNVNPVGPRGVYDEAKQFAEALTLAYYRCHGIDVRIARIFNTYGPHMRPYDGRVVSNFVVQALQGKNLTIYGDGNQTRSICYVDDLVEGLTRLLLADPETSRFRGTTELDGIHGPVNLGNPTEMRIVDIAQLVIRLTGSSSAVQHLPLPVDDPKVRRPDITRARNLLDWEPHVDAETGLRKTIAYFQSISADLANPLFNPAESLTSPARENQLPDGQAS
jgi:dTDP-glucose 4,6-dehydratase